jgi:excisionase family DNA binding protein
MTEIIKPAMTVRDVATMLNVDEKTIYRLVQKGTLPGFKVAGAWRFQWSDIQTWIDSKKQTSSTPVTPGSSESLMMAKH